MEGLKSLHPRTLNTWPKLLNGGAQWFIFLDIDVGPKLIMEGLSGLHP